MNPKVDSWRTPKDKAAPRASLGGPSYAKVYDGPDQELAEQLQRYICSLKEKKRKGKEKATPFGANLLRSQV